MTATLAKSPVIRLDTADNVVVARVEIAAGTVIPSESLITLNDVPLGHKIATRPIAKGEAIRKYDTVIGFPAPDRRREPGCTATTC
jgi:altronate hydrolase